VLYCTATCVANWFYARDFTDLLVSFPPYIQVQIQLDRQKYLQDRAGQDESALRVQDERIPTGASRPMLTPQEQAECEVSVAAQT
jgi:hypothetical protein